MNLNAANVHKFSDADFPQWKGWALIDDDTNGDSRCDSAALRQTIYDNGAACLQPSKQHATAQLNSPVVQAKLARTVAKFPSEWDASTIDQRWAWLKTQSDENPNPLTADDYAKLKAHAEALCLPFPDLFTAQWCFHPREFIGHFRKCGWLSANEMAQCFPRDLNHLTGARLSLIPSHGPMLMQEARHGHCTLIKQIASTASTSGSVWPTTSRR